MQAVRAVKQNYTPTTEILNLLENFRKMVNDCIRIGLNENVTSRLSLTRKVYYQLKQYSVPTYYRLTAINKATGLLKNYRKTLRKHPNAKKPYATKQMLTDCYAFKIENSLLRLPLKPRLYTFISLNSYVLRSILGYTVRSVSLTACTLSIAFSKETAKETPITGLIGIDRNLDNVTTASSNGEVHRYDLSEATRIKTVYHLVKSHFKRNDARICQKIFRKYGEKQRHKVNAILHNVSKRIVADATQNKFGIVMENLKGIRKLYRKGNGQGRRFRGKMNSWSYYELQRQTEYKALWEGLPSIYVFPHKSSSTCAICGSQILECTERRVYCPTCKTLKDRDENASQNILNRGLRFSPVGLASEAMVKEPVKVILKVDASQATQKSYQNRMENLKKAKT